MRRTFVAATVVAGVGVCCGIALAAVTLPFSGDGNTINGCYSDRGRLVLLTPSAPECGKKFQPIQWSVTGPQGRAGTNGTNGVSPTVTQLSPGDAHCPAGGAAITDAANSIAYVCSGAAFSGTFTAGDYSISVTSSGITLAGPLSERITLTDTGLTIDSGGNSLTAKSSARLSIKSTQAMNVESSTGLNLNGVSTKVEGTAIVDVTGGITRLGGGCLPVARVGDLIVGSGMGAVTGNIITGSPRVLSC